MGWGGAACSATQRRGARPPGGRARTEAHSARYEANEAVHLDHLCVARREAHVRRGRRARARRPRERPPSIERRARRRVGHLQLLLVYRRQARTPPAAAVAAELRTRRYPSRRAHSPRAAATRCLMLQSMLAQRSWLEARSQQRVSVDCAPVMSARRTVRLRREYLYRKSLEGEARTEYERKMRVRRALADGKPGALRGRGRGGGGCVCGG